MNVRTKSALVLVATLILGMVLGAMLFGTVQRQRFQHALRLARPDRFTASVEQVVRPVDDEQRRALGQVLQAYDDRARADRQRRIEHMRASLDTLQAQLSAFLDEDQMERLREHVIRHRQALRRPPPGERPPPPPE